MGVICPLSWPFYGAAVFLSPDELPRHVARAMPLAFWFMQGVTILIVLWLLRQLRESRRKISEASKEG